MGPGVRSDPWGRTGRVGTVHFRVKGELAHHWTGSRQDTGRSGAVHGHGPVRNELDRPVHFNSLDRNKQQQDQPSHQSPCQKYQTVKNRPKEKAIHHRLEMEQRAILGRSMISFYIRCPNYIILYPLP
jgi:hypothetical protein